MPDSNITKLALAKALKKLTHIKSFEKISISDITKECGLNRQTFYYHFEDKYELLEWVYYEEGFRELTQGISLENWDQKLLILLNKMQKEQVFYRNTICKNEEYFQKYLLKIIQNLFLEAILKLDEKKYLKEQERWFYSRYFAFGMCGIIIEWVHTNMKESPEKITAQLKKLVFLSEKLAYERYAEERNVTE